MKFALAILAVATAALAAPIEEEHHKCEGICTMEWNPITCSNGVTYGNPCKLERAKCDPRAFDGVTCEKGAPKKEDAQS